MTQNWSANNSRCLLKCRFKKKTAEKVKRHRMWSLAGSEPGGEVFTLLQCINTQLGPVPITSLSPYTLSKEDY